MPTTQARVKQKRSVRWAIWPPRSTPRRDAPQLTVGWIVTSDKVTNPSWNAVTSVAAGAAVDAQLAGASASAGGVFGAGAPSTPPRPLVRGAPAGPLRLTPEIGGSAPARRSPSSSPSHFIAAATAGVKSTGSPRPEL